MKIRNITLILLFLSILDLAYWIYFWEKNYTQTQSNFLMSKEKYINSLPNFIRPLYGTTPQIIDVLLFIGLTFCGILIVKKKSNKVLIFIVFLFAFRHLFSMM